MRPSTVSTMCRRSAAWTSMSAALPPIPAEPRCMRMRACGNANRLPLAPAESRNCPALQASPSARVDTSHGTSRITSRIASSERQQLRRKESPVVVVEHPIKYEYSLEQQLLPYPLTEQRALSVLSHASSLRHNRPQAPHTLL